jgi:1-deoxy-D-xylulose-5-phosphate synthase
VTGITLAVRRVFQSAADVIVFDSGTQAGGEDAASGRTNTQSGQNWLEDAQASTVFAYVHGLARARRERGSSGRIVAVVGESSIASGMAFEGLRNLGVDRCRCTVVLNARRRSRTPVASDPNNVSGAPYVSYNRFQRRFADLARSVQASGEGVTYSALRGLEVHRRTYETRALFESLGWRYSGPWDGDEIAQLESALSDAYEYDGPMAVHLVAADYTDSIPDHELPASGADSLGSSGPAPERSYGSVFVNAFAAIASADPLVHAIGTSDSARLRELYAMFAERSHDVGSSRDHALASAVGMAHGGLRPVVIGSSPFFAPGSDPARHSRLLDGLPLVLALEGASRAGGGTPCHGAEDVAFAMQVEGLAVLAPSSAQELENMLRTAVEHPGPVLVSYPAGTTREVDGRHVGVGHQARRVRVGRDVCLLAVGTMLGVAEAAGEHLDAQGIDATVWDVRALAPMDPAMISDATRHPLVVTVEQPVTAHSPRAAVARAVARVSANGAVASTLDAAGIVDVVRRHLRTARREPAQPPALVDMRPTPRVVAATDLIDVVMAGESASDDHG